MRIARRVGWLFALGLAFTSRSYAMPVEDHWSVDMDPATTERMKEVAHLVRYEQFDQALPKLQVLAEELPANPDVFNLLGYAYRKSGNLTDAAPAYERALYLKPDHLGALQYQAELFITLGDIEEAEKNLARLEELCAWPCAAHEELSESIAAWRAEQTN